MAIKDAKPTREVMAGTSIKTNENGWNCHTWAPKRGVIEYCMMEEESYRWDAWTLLLPCVTYQGKYGIRDDWVGNSWPWSWKQYGPSKSQELLAQRHSITFQIICIFNNTTLRTSNLAWSALRQSEWMKSYGSLVPFI